MPKPNSLTESLNRAQNHLDEAGRALLAARLRLARLRLALSHPSADDVAEVIGSGVAVIDAYERACAEIRRAAHHDPALCPMCQVS